MKTFLGIPVNPAMKSSSISPAKINKGLFFYFRATFFIHPSQSELHYHVCLWPTYSVHSFKVWITPDLSRYFCLSQEQSFL